MIDERKVDLFTTSPNLEDLMVRSYPGELFEDQFSKSEDPDGKVYGFIGLHEPLLVSFLKHLETTNKITNSEQYEIRDHSTGEIKYLKNA